MSDPTPCPAPAELRRFDRGELPEPGFGAVAAHVLGCAACQRALAAPDGGDDPLVALVREAAQGAEPQDDAPEELVARLGTSGGEAPSAGGDAVFDHGARLAGRLAAGPCRVGRFELVRGLGAGSFGHVFLAKDVELDRSVAVKVLRTGGPAGPRDVERFHREARNTARLRHPGIVSLFESGTTEDGVCFLVTEYVPGRTLEERHRNGRMAFADAARIVAEAADALDDAHRHGVVHRDVKPSNLLLDEDGHPHVTDFGLAKREGTASTATGDGMVLGTPAYMSPEQARGDARGVDARTDIYSLGVVLYELLAGQRPFEGNRRMLMLQVLEDEPRPPHRLDERVPRDLETICLKAMAKAPGRRYATAKDLADDLRRWLAGEPIRARPIGRLALLGRWCRRNPLAAGLLVAISVGATIGLVSLATLSEELVRMSAYDGARIEADILEEMNDFYSEIVGRLDPRHVSFSHEFAAQEGALPLPATFTIEAGRRLSGSDSGMQVRLYSDHPFPWRSDGGPKDAFEADALARLRAHPTDAVHEFTDLGGRPVLRYARARLMKQSCIDCHNHHPQTPKDDWQEGDVRGVLEVIRPLDRDAARTREGFHRTFVRLAASLLLALWLSVLVLAVRRPPARRPA